MQLHDLFRNINLIPFLQYKGGLNDSTFTSQAPSCILFKILYFKSYFKTRHHAMLHFLPIFGPTLNIILPIIQYYFPSISNTWDHTFKISNQIHNHIRSLKIGNKDLRINLTGDAYHRRNIQ